MVSELRDQASSKCGELPGSLTFDFTTCTTSWPPRCLMRASQSRSWKRAVNVNAHAVPGGDWLAAEALRRTVEQADHTADGDLKKKRTREEQREVAPTPQPDRAIVAMLFPGEPGSLVGTLSSCAQGALMCYRGQPIPRIETFHSLPVNRWFGSEPR